MLVLGLFAFLLWAGGVLGYQIIFYLKNGAWQPLSVIDGLVYLSQERPSLWLLYPQDWIGLHKLLEAIPLSLGIALLGVLWAIVTAMIKVKYDELKNDYNENLRNKLLKEREQRQKQRE